MSNSYFEITYRNYKKITCYSYEDTRKSIEDSLNKDRQVAESIVEKNALTDEVITVFKPQYSATLIWTQTANYSGGISYSETQR
jgi:formaldehyde-activating enzyme involved in methanogenesis